MNDKRERIADQRVILDEKEYKDKHFDSSSSSREKAQYACSTARSDRTISASMDPQRERSTLSRECMQSQRQAD